MTQFLNGRMYSFVPFGILNVHFKLGIITSLTQVLLVAVVGTAPRGEDDGTGDPRDVWQDGRGPGQRGGPALEEELTVIDYPGASGGGAEHGPAGRAAAVLGHQRGVVHRHPPGGRGDVHAPGVRAVGGGGHRGRRVPSSAGR